MFVYGDVVYAQTWQVLTLKNCMEPFSYASAAYVVASALVSVRLFCKNLGNLKTFFGQMVYRPLWQKITRTPMVSLQPFHSQPSSVILEKTLTFSCANKEYDTNSELTRMTNDHYICISKLKRSVIGCIFS